MQGLQKSIYEELLPKVSLQSVNTPAGVAVNGAAVDLQNLLGVNGLPCRFNSVMAVVSAGLVGTSGVTLAITGIKIQGAADSAFTTPVDLATQTPLGVSPSFTLTGDSAGTAASHINQVKLGVDLTSIAQAIRYVRVIAIPTLSDVTTSKGDVTGTLVFGGGQEVPV